MHYFVNHANIRLDGKRKSAQKKGDRKMKNLTKKAVIEKIESEGTYEKVRINKAGEITAIENKINGWEAGEKEQRIFIGWDTEIVANYVDQGVFSKAQGDSFFAKFG